MVPGAQLDFSHHHRHELWDSDTSCQPWGAGGLLWIYCPFFSIHKGRRFPSFCLVFIFWFSFGMGLVALQESPSAGRENVTLHCSWNLGKSTRGWNTWDLLLEWGKKETNTNAGNSPLDQHSGELVELHWDIPGCCHPATPGISWIPTWLRGLARKGLGLGWVFTLTTKARLCWTFLGEVLGLEKLNSVPGSSRGDNRALQGVGCSLREEIQAGTIPVPSGSSRDPTEVRKGRQDQGSAPGLVGSLERSQNQWKHPGLMVFLCFLNPQD